MAIKDETTRLPLEPSNVRKGRFLWMSEKDRQAYVTGIQSRISKGYYYSDRVLSEIVNDLAPVIDSMVNRDESRTSMWQALSGIAAACVMQAVVMAGRIFESLIS